MSHLKYLLTRVGEHMSEEAIFRLLGVLNYLETGRWMRAHGFDARERVERREALFGRIASDVGDKRVLYLEFGVHEGASLRLMAKLLKNQESRLQGFDSFEGLPEKWLPDRAKGHFSLDGEIPRFDDPRIELYKGWFNETLPGHIFPDHEVLVVNFDADLYTSTAFVLDAIWTLIKPGSYLYFDEFNQMNHELRAFDEFLSNREMQFELLGATKTLQKVLFRRVA